MDNKEKIYKDEIAPCIEKLLAVCNNNGIPFFVAFATKENPDGSLELKAQGMVPEEFHYNSVKDRRFSDFINIVNGFKAVIEEPKNIIDEDEWGGLPTGYGQNV